MFVLTVDARTQTPDALRGHVLAWPAEVGPVAVGWLGNTAGASRAGEFVFLLRFESEEAAWLTSDLPEYGRWWRTCARHLTSTPKFTPSTDVTGILGGGSDRAAAVRITRGRATPGRRREGVRRLEQAAREAPTALIGGIVAWHEGDLFTEAVYLASSEAVAPALLAAPAASVGDATVIDLADPWLTSPQVAR